MSAVVVGRSDLVAALRELGVEPGDGIFVHSAMSVFGRIEGGPDGVVDALEEAVGPQGVVAMPSFPLIGGTLEYLSGDPLFDIRETPSRMGAVTEAFRRRPGVVRSLHPSHPVAALGPGADDLVKDHELAATPFGDGTPFARMIERGFVQVWLGTGIRIFTLYHSFESMRPGGYPIDVFLPDPTETRCVDAEGRERTVRTLVHDPKVGSQKNARREEMRRRLEARGVLRAVNLGRGEVLAARMPELMDALEILLREGITIYDIEVESPSAAV